MEDEKGQLFVDPCAVAGRRLGQGGMDDLAGGLMPVAPVLGADTTITVRSSTEEVDTAWRNNPVGCGFAAMGAGRAAEPKVPTLPKEPT